MFVFNSSRVQMALAQQRDTSASWSNVSQTLDCEPQKIRQPFIIGPQLL